MAAHPLSRRLIAFLSAVFAALFVVSLTPAPAHATYGPAIPVDIQLRSYDSYGNEYRVGRVVGTVQFDDGNSAYYISLTVCRQSSYTSPNAQVLVNGVSQFYLSSWDGVARPQVCGDAWGQSGATTGGFSYGGVVRNLTVTIQGIHFDGSQAKEIVRSRTYDNPYN
jgi:hypothetical protein